MRIHDRALLYLAQATGLAITADDLAFRLGCSERYARQIVADLVSYGEPICSTIDGYIYGAEPLVILKEARRLRQFAASIVSRANDLEVMAWRKA